MDAESAPTLGRRRVLAFRQAPIGWLWRRSSLTHLKRPDGLPNIRLNFGIIWQPCSFARTPHIITHLSVECQDINVWD
jgi:hypothetical protein